MAHAFRAPIHRAMRCDVTRTLMAVNVCEAVVKPYTRWLVKPAVYAAISYVTIRRYVEWGGFEMRAPRFHVSPPTAKNVVRRSRFFRERRCRDVPVHALGSSHLGSSRIETDPLEPKLERETRRDLTINLRCFPASYSGRVAVKIEFHLNLMKYLIKSAFETRDRESAYRYLRPTLLESAHKVVTTTDWIGERARARERKREGDLRFLVINLITG